MAAKSSKLKRKSIKHSLDSRKFDAKKPRYKQENKKQKHTQAQNQIRQQSKAFKTAKNNYSSIQQKSKNQSSKIEKVVGQSQLPIRIYFLGGINEVGKNMTVFEYNNEMIILDCGLAFPDDEMPGVDLVIPDFSFVEENRDKIKGIIITHGHEDHIGGLAYLLEKNRFPVYGTKLTIGLIEGKLREHNLLGKVELHTAKSGDIIDLGEFSAEFIHVNHSIPDAVGFAIKCGGGTIVHTGDFKIDSTPIDGGMIDLPRFGQLGSEGVLCMMSDSTNAERQGYTQSERKVGESFAMLFRKAENKRIIVATFASNIHRVQQIINVAKTLGRKVALSGRSLENVVEISQKLGYLNVPDNTLIELDEIRQYPENKIVLITTGSQGEPMSALYRMAFSEHRMVKVTPNDYIIISSTPIPGNEKTVSKVVNELLQLGADVVYEKMYDVHVSGHACSEELKIMLGIVKPQYFIPVHGEKKHILKHAELAKSVGITKSNIAIAENGAAFELSENGIKKLKNVASGAVMIDGTSVGDIVMTDRKRLAQSGIFIISFAYDSRNSQIVSYPVISSRGFVNNKESAELIQNAQEYAWEILDNCQGRGKNHIKTTIKDSMGRYLNKMTGRTPMIIPVIIEVF